MRFVSNTVEICVKDELFEGEIRSFVFRKPNAQEQNKYNNKAHVMRNGKFKSNATLARVEFGLKHLISIGNEEYAIPAATHGAYDLLVNDVIVVGAGADKTEYLPISSDNGNKFYHAEWKKVVEEYAHDTLAVAAARLFEGSASLEDTELEIEDD